MRNLAVLSVILASTLGATSGIFVKYLNLPATTITFFRVIIPVILVGGYLLYKKVPLFRGNYKIMLFASCVKKQMTTTSHKTWWNPDA